MSDEHEHMEQHSEIKFLVQKNKTNAEIIKELTSAYGTHVVKSTAMKKWAGFFQSERESVCNDARANQPSTVCNTRNVEKAKQEIKKNHRTMIRDVADSINISHTSVHKILLQNLGMKVCSKLVLKVLTPEQKKELVMLESENFSHQ